MMTQLVATGKRALEMPAHAGGHTPVTKQRAVSVRYPCYVCGIYGGYVLIPCRKRRAASCRVGYSVTPGVSRALFIVATNWIIICYHLGIANAESIWLL